MSNKLAKDDTLQSLVTANQAISTGLGALATLAKDASIQQLITAVQGLNTGSGGGGTTISNSTVEITGGESTITGGNTWFTEDSAGVVNITDGSNTTINGGVIYVGELPEIPTGFYIHKKDTTSAQSHNESLVTANLGETISEAQSAAIKAGNFHNIYPGGYWEKTITYEIPYNQTRNTSATDTTQVKTYNQSWAIAQQLYTDKADYESTMKTLTRRVRMRICHLDYLLDEYNTEHHVVVMPDLPLFLCPMCPSDNATYMYDPNGTAIQYLWTHPREDDNVSVNQGYAETYMFTEWLKYAAGAFVAFFGEDHIYKHTELFIKNLNWASNQGVLYPKEITSAYYKNRMCDIPSAHMCFSDKSLRTQARSDVYSSTERFTRDEALEQLSLFRLTDDDPQYIKTQADMDDTTRINWFTRTQYNIYNFLVANSLDTDATQTTKIITNAAYNMTLGIRPYALIN